METTDENARIPCCGAKISLPFAPVFPIFRLGSQGGSAPCLSFLDVSSLNLAVPSGTAFLFWSSPRRPSCATVQHGSHGATGGPDRRNIGGVSVPLPGRNERFTGNLRCSSVASLGATALFALWSEDLLVRPVRRATRRSVPWCPHRARIRDAEAGAAAETLRSPHHAGDARAAVRLSPGTPAQAVASAAAAPGPFVGDPDVPHGMAPPWSDAGRPSWQPPCRDRAPHGARGHGPAHG